MDDYVENDLIDETSDFTTGNEINRSDQSCGLMHMLIHGISMLLVIITFPFSMFITLKIVPEYERAVIFRLGKYAGTRGPGIFFVLPCIDEIRIVDIRTVTFEIPPQEILTKDSVTCSVDAVVYYSVTDPKASIVNVEDCQGSTRFLAQTTLRNQLGSVTLAGLLSERDEIANTMQVLLDTGTDPWGVKVERVEVKDVRLPQNLQRAMAAAAEATREAKAKIIAADGEKNASASLRDAAAVIGVSSGAMQLRYLQTLTQISVEKNSTIIFPLPIEILSSFEK